VASWSVPATKTLIGICIENKEEYDKPIRHTRFWSEVSKQLAEEKFYFTPAQCENKMKSLTALYKDYAEAAERTGAAGPYVTVDDNTRTIMELLETLLKNCVTVEPKVTMAAGFKVLHKHSALVKFKR
jgi:hypothetical protein